MQAEQFKIEVEKFEAETPNAVLVRTEDPNSVGQYITWFPLSQVHSIHRAGTSGWIMVTPWIAKQKGFL